MSLMNTYTLENGVKIPVLGFGTWQTPAGKVATDAVLAALDAGFTHIDTAEMYGNEKSIGQAVKASGIARSDLFITSKLDNQAHTYELATQALDRSLSDLQTDYLDLFLIHWPNPKAFRDHDWEKHLQETWRALEDAYTVGKVKAIGVSNFKPKHFEVLKKTQKIQPMVDQIRICPGDVDRLTIDYCQQHDILLEAYSPFGTGQIFANETLKALAQKKKRSVAQLCLRWSLQHGYLPLPKSVHPARIKENTEVFDFELTESEMQQIDALQGVAGFATDPDTADF